MPHDLAGEPYWIKSHQYPLKHSKVPSSKFLIFLKECVYFSFSQYELFFRILPKYLKKGQSFLEIGSAPGKNLALINKLFGCDVFGIEKDATGYRHNVEIFRINNLPKRVFKADVFKFNTSKKYDVVFSNGFIEHFADPGKAIDVHSRLLNKDGLIICIIPNFLNLNFLMQKILDEKNLSYHNLDLMQPEIFKKLFTQFNPLLFGYFGIFSMRIFKVRNKNISLLINLLKPLRFIFNPLAILLMPILKTRKLKNSPFLIFIGRKKL